ncbi:lytic polysaccharide monooxygenase [Karstenula rhodostoma CBS 690.94]|uniref:Lytic polysaccharide monooxygenase n=1 Tax=Karstenula rhodostoma CBS 690.94 TaxID=1392251 RepID=A0A9P4U8C3_9PLEO|nr:lytic polysaccharide monooxygenase [Karstenula rhodostoma CBS 690.94]
MSSTLLKLVALAATAAAHGTVTGIVADGTYTKGFDLQYYYMLQQGQTPPETPGWYAENLENGFVAPSAYATADIVCHKNSKAGTSSATVKAGGKVDFQWSKWPESHIGPMLTYVAKCEADCTDADKTALKWVKIDEAGFTDDWASNKMIANNNTWSVTVPSTLASGNYVFRHETIALHGAGSEDGAQNYPQCLNIEITGGGSDNPEGVLGTALYTSKDAGILYNPYSGDDSGYKIPGPALYGSASGTTPTTPVSSSPAASASASASASAPASSTVPSATASASATAVAEATPSATAGAGSGSGSTLPKTFTVSSFIQWLEQQSAASAKAKARRHARQFA